MATDLKSDVHSLAVVCFRTMEQTSTGRIAIKEQWLKANIIGAEGSVSEKFALLFKSHLQFKVGLSQRVADAKASDTYYPKGKECAQLFSVLSNHVGVVDMADFDVAKWEKRFPVKSHAGICLAKYADSIKPAVVPEIPAPVADTTTIPVGENRMTHEEVPTTPAKPARRNGKKEAQPV